MAMPNITIKTLSKRFQNGFCILKFSQLHMKVMSRYCEIMQFWSIHMSRT